MSDVGQHLLSGIAPAIRRQDRPVTFFLGAISGFASSFLLQPCTSALLSSRPVLLLTTLLVDLIKTRIQQGDAPLAKMSALFALLRPNLTSLFIQASWRHSLHHAIDRFFLGGTRSLARHVRNLNPVYSPHFPFFLWTDCVSAWTLKTRLPETYRVSRCTLPA